jgi:hypothetical protein
MAGEALRELMLEGEVVTVLTTNGIAPGTGELWLTGEVGAMTAWTFSALTLRVKSLAMELPRDGLS